MKTPVSLGVSRACARDLVLDPLVWTDAAGAPGRSWPAVHMHSSRIQALSSLFPSHRCGEPLTAIKGEVKLRVSASE